MALQSENNLAQKCRTCLIEDSNMCFLYENINLIEDVKISLSEVITLCTSIQISRNDLMPQYLCKRCVSDATKSYQFRIQCEKSDKLLRKEMLENLQQKIEDEDHDNTEIRDSYIDGEISQHIPILKSNSEDELKINEEDQKFKCISCDASFSKRKDLNIHMQSHNEHKCKQCHAKFSKVVHLRKHIRTHREPCHNKLLTVPLEQRTCDQCGKQFQYRSSMLKHKRKHSAPPKSCTYCNEVPNTPAQLAQHMEKEHSHLKTVVCTECGKTFFKETNLRLHMIIHSGVKRHTCEICGLSFALSGNLAAHRRLHTGEKPYTCSHCGRGFTQQAALRSHEAGHSNKRDHVCPDCGAAFSRVGALRNHRKRHLPSRPFVCSMCGKAFTFSSERKRHMVIHSGVKNHVCEVCGRRFNRNTNLKVHMRIHTGETPHTCHVCGRGFIQAHCLRTHMNTHQID